MLAECRRLPRETSSSSAHAENTDAGADADIGLELAPRTPEQNAALRRARELDRRLRALARQEAKCRRVLGWIARELLASQAYQTLGFARLSDYTRERLGLSARELQSLVHVGSALDQLPAIAAAFEAGDVSWTHARILVEVATRESEHHWLELARTRTVRALEACVRRHAGALPSSALNALDDSSEDGVHIDGEPAVPVRVACPRRLRRLWRAALELAERVAGARLSPWQAAEVIAAEGLSGAPLPAAAPARAWRDRGEDAARRASSDDTHRAAGDAWTTTALQRRARRAHANPNERSGSAAFDWPPFEDAIPREIWALAQGLAQANARELDARLRTVVRTMRETDAQLGRLLRSMVDDRLYQDLHFASAAHYVGERLGISGRKASGLVAIERRCAAAPTFGAAYGNGEISWVRALTLLPVIDERTAAAWVARAAAVTVRRLSDEVGWVLDRADTAEPDRPLAPPPARTVLAEQGLQMRARETGVLATETAQLLVTETGQASVAAVDPATNAGHSAASTLEPTDAEVRFTAPISVVALFRSALVAFATPGESPWRGLERLLDHVNAEWTRQPRHRDPVFARDGWRCAVPACSSRRNLQDHHIRFRSRGGTNARWNRVALCAWHHLRGIHLGIVEASGKAPQDVHWSLGMKSGTPFLRLVGDFYVLDASLAGTSSSSAGPVRDWESETAVYPESRAG